FGGTSHSQELSFTTLAAPSIGADEVSGVTQTTASLTAQVNPNLSATTYRFEYGPTAEYGSATRESSQIGADAAVHTASARLSGLMPGTTYHFRVVATNGVGKTADSDQVFTTTPTSATQPETTTSCKKGFVKRKGHCVKKRRRHRRHQHRAGRTRRSHG